MSDDAEAGSTATAMTTEMKTAIAVVGNTVGGRGAAGVAPEKPERQYGDFWLRDGHFVKSRGFNWLIGALFVVSEMAGGGIIALPGAINRASLKLGIPLLVIMTTLATISAVYLGKAWTIMLRMYPGYRTHCRKPYAEMGYRAVGPVAKIFVSMCLNMTQFGASTCFLLVIARSTSNFVLFVTEMPVSFCYIILAVAVIISPILMCKSPSDFWPAIVGGMAATMIAVALISLGAYWDGGCASHMDALPARTDGVLLSLGVILFTIGGHSAFPTIQHDMRRPADFGKSAVLAFIVLTGLNLTVVLWGSLTYGSALTESITESIQTPIIQQAVNALIGLHCLMTLTLLMNPFYQEMEEHLRVPQEFGWKRIALRGLLLFLLAMLALSVPKFESILGFVGGCLLTVTSLVLPPIFYLFLAANERRVRYWRRVNNAGDKCSKFVGGALESDDKNAFHVAEEEDENEDSAASYGHISIREVIKLTDGRTLSICLTIIGAGLILGATATITSIRDMTQMEVVPCYVALFNEELWSHYLPERTITRCCGPGQDVSLRNSTCPEPNFKFYNATIF